MQRKESRDLKAMVLECISSNGVNSPLNLSRVRKFARKARDYKMLYLDYHTGGNNIKTASFHILEQQMKEKKKHRSVLDVATSALLI